MENNCNTNEIMEETLRELNYTMTIIKMTRMIVPLHHILSCYDTAIFSKLLTTDTS